MPDAVPRTSLVFLIAALIVIALLSGCASGMRRAELVERLGSDHPPLVIDVRTAGEYRDGHVPGAVHIPFTKLRSHADILRSAAGDRPIVVYCAHGPRAGIAGMSLRSVGFEEVYSLSGHMRAWRRHGLLVEATPNALPARR